MFRTVVAFAYGVYVGQEYVGLPRVKTAYNHIVNDIQAKLNEYTEEPTNKSTPSLPELKPRK